MQQNAKNIKRCYTAAEAAKLIRRNSQTISIWVRSGKIEGAKLGRNILVDANAFDQRVARAFAGGDFFGDLDNE
jgi:excisionase family DNA binding protein